MATGRSFLQVRQGQRWGRGEAKDASNAARAAQIKRSTAAGRLIISPRYPVLTGITGGGAARFSEVAGNTLAITR